MTLIGVVSVVLVSLNTWLQTTTKSIAPGSLACAC